MSKCAFYQQDGAPVRRGYVSAEDKIQEELKEMRRREEELRYSKVHHRNFC